MSVDSSSKDKVVPLFLRPHQDKEDINYMRHTLKEWNFEKLKAPIYFYQPTVKPNSKGGTVKEPGEEGNQGCVGGGIVNRAADDKPVAGFKLDGGVIDSIVKHALARLCTAAAGDAAAYGLITDVQQFGFDALAGKNLFHFVQGNRSVAVCAGASVNHQYLQILFLHVLSQYAFPVFSVSSKIYYKSNTLYVQFNLQIHSH